MLLMSTVFAGKPVRSIAGLQRPRLYIPRYKPDKWSKRLFDVKMMAI
jgi:hypothetical protein